MEPFLIEGMIGEVSMMPRAQTRRVIRIPPEAGGFRAPADDMSTLEPPPTREHPIPKSLEASRLANPSRTDEPAEQQIGLGLFLPAVGHFCSNAWRAMAM